MLGKLCKKKKKPPTKKLRRIFKELASVVVQCVLRVNVDPERQTVIRGFSGSKVNKVTPSLAEPKNQLRF